MTSKSQRNNPWALRKAYGIMGIINITPDSFYDGGRSREATLEHVRALHNDGADILDVGAESTRPGAEPLDQKAELARLTEVFDQFRQAVPEAVWSLDTCKAATAAWACENGFGIINDISGATHDPGMIDVLAHFNPGFVLVHSNGPPRTMQLNPWYENVTDNVMAFFENATARLVKAGLAEDRIVLDPGIGFGKTMEHNLELLRNIGRFLKLGRPLLAGLSMKSFFGDLLGLPLEQRGCPTAVACALLWERGVAWHRVHEVRPVRAALDLSSALV